MINKAKVIIYYIQISYIQSTMKLMIKILTLILVTIVIAQACQVCYEQRQNTNCREQPNNITSYTLHMAVHPHLDAFWIFDFQSYYNPQPGQGNVLGYFSSNRFHSVKQIFDTTLDVLHTSKLLRQKQGGSTQREHRSFFNSEMGFFKRWYFEQPPQKKQILKQILKTKYWQILGGGVVEHDEGCAYYDDIIQNFQTGLRFLKQEFGYYPRAAVSADSFGHSQTTLAILAHLGIEGFFVQRSDEHILLQNKTQFIWKAKSANGHYYGALPTHIRWAIHGFEDQFIPGGDANQNFCQTKGMYVNNMVRQNEFLKRILKSSHIMRYFGHDFQQFDNFSYSVIEGIMQKFSMQKCNKVTAVYGNPTQYFITLMSQVFGKVKPLATRQEDIMPIWDYDSGLYWTGYYTTDQFHKKYYRDAGRYLYAGRKIFTPAYIADPKSDNHIKSYRILQQFAQTVAYLQHHDGISGTSKYEVMDKYETVAQKSIQLIKKSIFQEMFEIQFPNNTNNPIFYCNLQSECTIPEEEVTNDIYLKVFKTGAQDRKYQAIIVHLNQNQFYQPDCKYEVNCMCPTLPCACDLYLYPQIGTYGLIRLKKIEYRPKQINMMQLLQKDRLQGNQINYNQTHFTIKYENNQYHIGYKRLNGDPTSRSYDHLSRYGDQVPRSFSIRSGKYALGNNVKTEVNLSNIRKVFKLQSERFTKYLILWGREHMKTVITIPKQKKNQWKVQTYSSAESGKLEDLYLQINAPHIENNKKFYTDSNGWLVMKRQLFAHEDYKAFFSPEGYDDIDGNSYPMTAFAYICDQSCSHKVSVNTDRPQGAIAYKPGTLWINYDRLSSDDGKWVYENTYRSEYQKFVHYVTVQNKDNNQRRLQKQYDEPLIIQGNSVSPSERISTQDFKYSEEKSQWDQKTNIKNIKFSVKPWNDSSLLLRVQNLNDTFPSHVELFSLSDKICTFLTAYYGNQIKFQSVYESNLGGNVDYESFLKKKWNWNNIVNLQKQNEIFNKIFGQSITLRPLQIRTFVFQGIKIDTQNCKSIRQIKYLSGSKSYGLDITKVMPMRNDSENLNQMRVNNYLLKEDHCKVKSPIKNIDTSVIQQQPKTHEEFQIQKTKPSTPVLIPSSTPEIKQNQFVRPPPNPNPNPNPQLQNEKKPQPKIQQKTLQQLKPRAPERNNEANSFTESNNESQLFSEIRTKIKSRKVISKSQKQQYFGHVLQVISKKLTKSK